MQLKEVAPAKLNLALHIRGKLPDGRHRLETVFAFCIDGDVVTAEPSDQLKLHVEGPFATDVPTGGSNLIAQAANQLADKAGVSPAVRLTLFKKLPVASGIGGGSADAAATLRLLTRMWRLDPGHASVVAPKLGSDVPACLLSMTSRGEEAGDALKLVDDAFVADKPVLLVNPLTPLSTARVFAGWDGIDRGPLRDWHEGRNDLEAPARALVPAIGDMLRWLGGRDGVEHVRMSGSGATCFALFSDEQARDRAAAEAPPQWWHLATFLR